MKFALLLCLCLLAASCGDDKDGGDSKAEVRKDPVCGKVAGTQSLCLPEVDWTIDSSSVNFPKKFALSVKDNLILDTCKPQHLSYELGESEGRTQLKLRFGFVPKETFKLELVDRGEDCSNNAIFHVEDEVRFGTAEMTINGKKSYSVYVNLSN